MASKSKKWFVFCNNHVVVAASKEPLLDSQIATGRTLLQRIYTISETSEEQLLCAEWPNPDTLLPNTSLLSLRAALEAFGSTWYNSLIKAYSIINWDKYHTFCGHCACPTEQPTQLFERVCPQCQHVFYPRISPSVIVLIHDQDRILMARSPHFTKGVYGLIAGFIEPGESAEQAVSREVKEEVGVEICDLRYFSSQAWPFPDSLMFGFIARYAGGELIIDNKEIEHADWYHYTNLPGYPRSPISISNKLLQHFIDSKNAGKMP